MADDGLDLAAGIDGAYATLTHRLGTLMPKAADRIGERFRALSRDGRASSYFLHPQAFPTMQLPVWLDQTLGGPRPGPWHADLLYSSVAGYYLLRLIDDAMDDDQRAHRALLPVLAVLSEEFRRPYARLLGDDATFWGHFDRIWGGTADAAISDALLPSIDASTFHEISAHKVSAATIPMHAVARLHGYEDLPHGWDQLVPRLGAWHQMRNDLADWMRDDQEGRVTYFLAEGHRRKATDETLASWVIREGMAWGWATVHARLDALDEVSRHLGSTPLTSYLADQRERHATTEAETAAGLRTLRALLAGGSAS